MRESILFPIIGVCYVLMCYCLAKGLGLLDNEPHWSERYKEKPERNKKRWKR